MDSNDTKQIVISYYALRDACYAMLKPIKINLNDGETVHSMSEEQESDLECIQNACEGIQGFLGNIESEIDDLEESIFDDGEVDKAGKMINDILFDVQPPANTVANQMAENALVAAATTKRALYGRV